MAKIQVLDKQIAELIAAGEVVERPSAVIKELAENSIDAGASQITVELRKGGVSYMRVSDNGSGINSEDVPKAFLRHATSKISTQDDLFQIGTLGFRGEALASIAAMCKVEMQTRTQDSTEGLRYVIHGGEEVENEPAGCPRGTTIVVRDIFYNTPARMKFLKKDVAEGSAVSAVVEKLALAHPEISFKLIRDGQVKLHTPGDGNLLSSVHAIYSKEVSEALLPVDYEYGGIRAKGYITKPTHCRGNRLLQNFFINQRYVKTRTAAAALEEAYKHSVMVGKFPGCFLNIAIAYHNVDVNVHPAKTEVRFTNEKAVYDAVYYGVKSALGSFSNLEQPQPGTKKPYNPYTIDNKVQNPVQQRFTAQQYRQMVGTELEEKPAVRQETPKISQKPGVILQKSNTGAGLTFQDGGNGAYAPIYKRLPSSQTKEANRQDAPSSLKMETASPLLKEELSIQWEEQEENTAVRASVISTAKAEDGVTEDAAPDRFAGARLVGEVFSTYILLETENQLIFIDKHAAHERLRFNRLLEQVEKGERQLLLTPVAVQLAGEVYGTVVENLDAFLQVGILAEDFGNGAILVREMPDILSKEDVAQITEETALKLHGHQNDLTPESVYETLHSIACRGSVMAGEQSDVKELAVLLELLRQNQDVKFCPHGRPIEIAYSKYEIEKRFGRLG